ncbi:MAG: hypothetical protein JKX72_02045 [Robiginitomaculum sp.]|nr:hypothetical protein [Robiginitomaculum sp.]
MMSRRAASLSTRKYYQTDNQGSITAITGTNGTVTNKNTYNEYGSGAVLRRYVHGSVSGNLIRAAAFRGQQLSAVAGIFSASATGAAVFTAGATLPVAGIAGAAAVDMAAVSTGMDFLGASIQSFGIGNATPLASVIGDYFSGEIISKVSPALGEIMGLASDGSAIIGTPPAGVSC